MDHTSKIDRLQIFTLWHFCTQCRSSCPMTVFHVHAYIACNLEPCRTSVMMTRDSRADLSPLGRRINTEHWWRYQIGLGVQSVSKQQMVRGSLSIKVCIFQSAMSKLPLCLTLLLFSLIVWTLRCVLCFSDTRLLPLRSCFQKGFCPFNDCFSGIYLLSIGMLGESPFSRCSFRKYVCSV